MSDHLRPRRKRQKRQLACTRCRLKKTACDGRRPACSSCTLKGLQDECFYQDSVCSLPAPPLLSTSRASATPATTDVLLRADTSCLAIGCWSTDAKADDIIEEAHAQCPEITAVDHSHGSLISSSPRAESSYGASSNSAFLREIIVAADLPKVPLRPAQTTTVPTLLGFSTSRTSSPDSHSQLLMLPEPGLAEEFLQSYWNYVHPVFPILHEPTSTAQYRTLLQAKRKSNASADAVCQATLSITLALGAQRTESVSTAQRNQLADELYKQSCRLVCVDFLDESSINVVQLLLLRGIYLHYSTHADRCWNTIGVALRVAQGLGLNTENSKVKETNQLKREMRRRVWHCCITLDRLIATTFGRAPLLPRESSTPLPGGIDDEHLLQVGFGIQPLARPSRIDFFIHSMELIGILYDILARLYQSNEHDMHKGEHLPDESPEKIIVLATRIDNFEQHLPDFLKMEADLSAFDGELANYFQMQANILKSRTLWIRLLLLRPSLLAETRRRSSPDKAAASCFRLGDSVRHAIHQLCLETAHALLQEMHDKLGSLLQNSAWHVILFTFAAASTLVAATLCPDLHVNLSEGLAKDSWERAQHIFQYYQAQVPGASKGIQALQSFRSSVESFQNREDSCLKGLTVDSEAIDLGMAANNATFDNLFDSDWFNEAWFNSQETDTLTFSNSI